MRAVKKRNLWQRTEGSGIIWAMGVGAFMLILVGAILLVSLNYNKRALRNGDSRQAYLTARSAVDLFVNEFVGDGDFCVDMFEYLDLNETWTIDDMGFDEKMGTCGVTLTLSLESADTDIRTLFITGHAVYKEQQRYVTAQLVGNDNAGWQLSRYTDSDKGVVSDEASDETA